MKTDKNMSVINAALLVSKAALEQKMKDKDVLIKAEVEAQTAMEQKKLLEAMEDPEKLSPTHAKQRLKQQQHIITGSTIIGGLVGFVALAAIALSAPIAAAIGGFVAGTMLASVPIIALTVTAGVLAGAAIAAAGYGAGVVQAKLTPFTPTLLSEQKTEIGNKAKEKIAVEIIGNQLCELRLARTSGKLNQLEFAEVCEAMYDLAILQHKIPESIAQKLRESAQEARAIHKEEAQEKREEEKLEIDKKKTDKQEAREERKEDIVIEKTKQEMEVGKILALAKLRQSGDGDQMKDVLARMLGKEGDEKPIDLMQLAMMQTMMAGARKAA